MGKTLLFLLGLLAIAVTYWRPLRRVRAALGVGHFLSTGHAFLVMGLLLGALVGERPAKYTDDLGPIVAFAAGWVGFATGMRFEVRVLRTVPLRAFVVALLPALLAAITVGAAGGAVLFFAGAPRPVAFGAALVIAAAAASSGPTLAAIVRTRRAGRMAATRSVLQMIEFSAGFDDILVVVLAILAFTLFRAPAEPMAPAVLLALALGGGAVLGLVTWLFLGGSANDDERLLLGLAMLAFVAGFAGWLLVSPAAVSAVAAMVLVNLRGRRMALLLRAVRRVERPAVIILMIAIGFDMAGPLDLRVVLGVVLAMTGVRLGAKVLAGEVVSGRVPGAPGLWARKRWGYGLVPQGILGLMVALSFYHVWGDIHARSVLAAVAIASVLNEALGGLLMLRLLRRLAAREMTARARAEEHAA